MTAGEKPDPPAGQSERRRRLAALLDATMPESTRDDQPESGADDLPDDGGHPAAEQQLRDDVPPHHG